MSNVIDDLPSKPQNGNIVTGKPAAYIAPILKPGQVITDKLGQYVVAQDECVYRYCPDPALCAKHGCQNVNREA